MSTGAPSPVHRIKLDGPASQKFALAMAIASLEDLADDLEDQHDTTSTDHPNLEMRVSLVHEQVIATLKRVQESLGPETVTEIDSAKLHRS